MADLGLCISCYGAQQMIDAGDYEIVARRHILTPDMRAIVIYKGMGMCRAHFNLARGFPEQYPDESLPDELAEKVADDLEDKADKMDRNRKRRRRRG